MTSPDAAPAPMPVSVVSRGPALAELHINALTLVATISTRLIKMFPPVVK